MASNQRPAFTLQNYPLDQPAQIVVFEVDVSRLRRAILSNEHEASDLTVRQFVNLLADPKRKYLTFARKAFPELQLGKEDVPQHSNAVVRTIQGLVQTNQPKQLPTTRSDQPILGYIRAQSILLRSVVLLAYEQATPQQQDHQRKILKEMQALLNVERSSDGKFTPETVLVSILTMS